MKFRSSLLILLLLSGCTENFNDAIRRDTGRWMDNAEIIVETNRCRDADMRAVLICNVFNECFIQCRPTDEESVVCPDVDSD